MGSTPEPVARAADVMQHFPAPWAICGGWAVDAWLGDVTRDHGDVDLTVFGEDQSVIRSHLDGWLLNGHDRHDDDGTGPWDGRALVLPAHVHAYADDGFELDIQLNRRSGSDWVFSRRAGLVAPIDWYLRTSGWGVPTLAPEAVLFYKARGSPRPRDEADFALLVQTLDGSGRAWLRDAIGALWPDHGWLGALG